MQSVHPAHAHLCRVHSEESLGCAAFSRRFLHVAQACSDWFAVDWHPIRVNAPKAATMAIRDMAFLLALT